MECDGPFVVFHLECFHPVMLGAMPSIDYRVLPLVWAVPAGNAKRNTTIPPWIPGFHLGLELLDKTTNSSKLG